MGNSGVTQTIIEVMNHCKNILIKKDKQVWHQCLTPVIFATQETAIRRIAV
jgi:hypothetical protein